MEQKKNIAVVKTLEVKHAAAVARLERDFFPENQRNGYLKIKGIVLNNKRFQSDLAIGLFDKFDLVGYLLAYPAGFRNAAQLKHEKMVYMSDFAVIPAYRKYVVKMYNKHVLLSARKVFPSRPLITDAFEYYKNKWIKQEAVARAHGYALTRCDLLKNTRFDQDMFRLRWEPVGTTLHTVKDKYPFRMQPHIVHYLFQIFRLVTNKIGLNGLHV